MTVVLITDPTLMPDTQLSAVKKEVAEADKETVNKILKDLEKSRKSNADSGKLKKTFVTSFITEVKMETPPDDFRLNLFMKPSIDIVST